ncbi:MAG: PD-(D/E)XK nuclease family protein [Methyloceanibacter sp.]
MAEEPEITSLYNGSVELRFTRAAHGYEVRGFLGRERPFGADQWRPWQSVPSVTQILAVAAKPALIFWAASCAADYVGENLKPGIALDEVQISALVEAARGAHGRFSRKAKTIGGVAHEAIAQHLRRETVAVPVNEQAKRCFEAAVGWAKKHGFEPQLVEARLYSLKYGYAGTMDDSGVGDVDHRLSVVDFKSTKPDKTYNGFYPEYQFQLAAYVQAFAEGYGLVPGDIDRYIVRLGKDDGEFAVKKLRRADFKKDLKGFLGLKAAFERLEQMKPKVS